MRAITSNDILTIITALQAGKTVVFPTETSYGLGCDALNQKAVNKIFKIKGRRRGKPLLVVVPSKIMARQYLVWNKLINKLAKKYWLGFFGNGALTIIGESKNMGKKMARGVVSADNTVALRVTNNLFLKKLLKKFGRPLVATSANISGQGDIYDSQEVKKIFAARKFKPDFIVDAGKLPKRKPSTIVAVQGVRLKVVRRGDVVL